jgi:hypothetical protein
MLQHTECLVTSCHSQSEISYEYGSDNQRLHNHGSFLLQFLCACMDSRAHAQTETETVLYLAHVAVALWLCNVSCYFAVECKAPVTLSDFVHYSLANLLASRLAAPTLLHWDCQIVVKISSWSNCSFALLSDAIVRPLTWDHFTRSLVNSPRSRKSCWKI